MIQIKYEMILARDSETCFSLRHGWASHGYCSSRFTGWLQWLRTTNNCLPICFTARRKVRKDNKSEVQTRLVILPTSYIGLPQRVTKLGVFEEQLNLDVQPMELIFFKQNICVCWNDFCRANSLKYTRILVSYVIACEKAKIGPRWVRETEFLTQSHMLRNSPGVFRRVAVAARLFCLSLCSWHPSIAKNETRSSLLREARSAAYPNEKWVWN